MPATYPEIGYPRKPLFYPICVAAKRSGIRHYGAMPDEAYWTRVRERMSEMKVSQTALARELGLPSQSAISNLFLGKRQLKASEKIELEHLLQLEGDSNVTRVPIIGLTQAGNWREAIQMPSGHLPLLAGIAGRKAFAVEVKGDSMDRLVSEGGHAVVDPDDRTLRDQSIYLLENEEYETTIKQYHAHPPRFCPMSNNAEHAEFAVGDVKFRVIGRVVWVGARTP